MSGAGARGAGAGGPRARRDSGQAGPARPPLRREGPQAPARGALEGEGREEAQPPRKVGVEGVTL